MKKQGVWMLLGSLLVASAALAKSDSDFVATGNGTVVDAKAGLEWQQEDDGNRRTWSNALDYCEALELDGKADWRLPNIKELTSTINPRAENPASFSAFTAVQACYWSSTTNVASTTQAFIVTPRDSVSCGASASGTNTTSGGVRIWGKTSSYAPHVRCVRDLP